MAALDCLKASRATLCTYPRLQPMLRFADFGTKRASFEQQWTADLMLFVKF